MLKSNDAGNDGDVLTETRHTFDVDEISSLIHYDRQLSRHALQYENIIQACGFGRFHVILLCACGWAFVSDATEVQVVSFVLPAACDLEMTSSQKGWLNAIIFVGMMIGGYIFGGAADLKGRRSVLLGSMSINGIFGLLSAFAPTFGWFLALRSLSGIGVGAALPILFTYFAEFLSKERRGPMIGLLACFLMVGNIMTSTLAWVIIPSDVLQGYVAGFYVGSWRFFVAVCSLPALTATLMFYFLPESPKFLLQIGKVEKAKKVFEKIYLTNCKDKEKRIPVLISQCTLYDDELTKRNQFRGLSITIAEVLKATLSLFKNHLKSPTLVLLIIWFALSFGYYGLWMWLPEIFKRTQNCGSIRSNSGQTLFKHNNTNWTDINTNLAENNLTTISIFSSSPCDHDSDIYLQTFLVALSNFPGNVLTVTTINKVGRRNLLGMSLLLSSVAVFFIQLVIHRVEMMLMVCIFSGLSIVGWNVLNTVALENYPTSLRSTAFGLQTSVGRTASIIANVTFGILVDVDCAIPLVMVAGFLLIGGITAFYLPRTDDKMLMTIGVRTPEPHKEAWDRSWLKLAGL